MWWFAWCSGRGCGPAFPPRAGVGDGQGQGLELGNESAEAAVVVEPLPVLVRRSSPPPQDHLRPARQASENVRAKCEH